MGKKIMFLTYLLIFFMDFLTVNSCKPYINRENELLDFENNFIKKFNIYYEDEKTKLNAFDKYLSRKGAIYTRRCINMTQCEGKLPLTFKAGVTKFFGCSKEDFENYLNKMKLDTEKIKNNFIDFNTYVDKNRLNEGKGFIENIEKYNKNHDHPEIEHNIIVNKINKATMKNKNPFFGNINLINFDWRKEDNFKNIDIFQENLEDSKNFTNSLSCNNHTEKFNFVCFTVDNFNDHSKELQKPDMSSFNKYIKDCFKKYFNINNLRSFHNNNLISKDFYNFNKLLKLFKRYYDYVTFNSVTDLEFLLRNVGPIYIETKARGMDLYQQGIFNPESCEMIFTNGFTGVVIVGYGQENEYEYWIAKNFFGNDWGEEKGYFRILKYKNINIFNKNKIAIVLNMKRLSNVN